MACKLEHEWTAWYDHAHPGRTVNDYETSLHRYCSFDTIQTFWGAYYNMSSLQTLPGKSGFHIMKKGARPVWEDTDNGGIWHVVISKDNGPAAWKTVLMNIVSDQYRDELPGDHDINGISITNRNSEFLIQVWVNEDTAKNCMLDYFSSVFTDARMSRTPYFKSCKELIKKQ